MNNDSPAKAILVVFLTALVCSSLVSAAVVLLRPIQLNNMLLDRSRNIMQLTGLQETEPVADNEETLSLFKSLDARIVDIDMALFNSEIDPDTFNERKATNNPELSVRIPAAIDQAKLGRRSRYALVYLVWEENELKRLILPIHGAGMWATIYGYLALESDLNTIAAASFYEQEETPGLGDQITRPDWLEKWQGRQILDERGELRFAISGGQVDPGSPAAGFEVDALTGATVTADAVTALVRYWMGPDGYQPFLQHLREQNPQRDSPDTAGGS